jgi:hypothetical protein
MTSVFIENRLKSVIVPENISLKCQSDARILSKTENEKNKTHPHGACLLYRNVQGEAMLC